MAWQEIVGSLVPAATAFLPTPLGKGIEAIAKTALGLGEDASEKELEKAMANASPEQFVELKRAMNEHIQKMEELGIRAEELNVKDRDSARKRQVEMGDHTNTVLAVLVVCMWIYVQYFFLNYSFPAENKELLIRALGILDGVLISVVTFYFGSSKGSKDKTKHMANKGE